jgi:hypothetical protein
MKRVLRCHTSTLTFPRTATFFVLTVLRMTGLQDAPVPTSFRSVRTRFLELTPSKRKPLLSERLNGLLDLLLARCLVLQDRVCKEVIDGSVVMERLVVSRFQQLLAAIAQLFPDSLLDARIVQVTLSCRFF